MKYILTLIFIIGFSFAVSAQTEILTNGEIILMTKAGLNRELIRRKITDSKGRYDTTAQALIELKKSGVADDVILLMLENTNAKNEKNSSATSDSTSKNMPQFPASQPNSTTDESTARIVLEPKEALRAAKTIAIEKSTLHPSRQALEKELLKRDEWRRLDLNIVRYKESADLYVEIGFVPLSILTHRYVFRVYDRKSGTVLAAGETTSWGNLAENLARHISKKLIATIN